MKAGYNFDLRGIMASFLGGVMGDWSETTHKAGGLFSGTASTRPVPVRGQFMSDLT
jgi:hypothetical protein